MPTAALRIEADRSVAGHDPAALVATHGSPLYVYDAAVLRARADALRAALPGSVELAFATKANSSPAVLRVWQQRGLGADVASGGELRAVLRAGFDRSDIVFTGPGKTDSELAEALEVGVGALTIESLDELDVVIAMAGRARPGQGLMLRLATEARNEQTPIIGAAGADKFGLTDAEAREGLSWLARAGSLSDDGPFRMRGFHAFGASNVRDATTLVEGVVELAERAVRLAAAHGMEVELLDAGGGLGIPYAADETPLDLAELGAGVAAEIATWTRRHGLATARLLFEPGRWLAGPAGVYLCRITRTKARGDGYIAISDGGIHHLLRPRLVGQDHLVVPVGEAASRRFDSSVDLVGPLCTGIDVLASGVMAGAPETGDLYAVLDAGAYGYSESMPLFLSHPTPAEIVLDGEDITVSRERIEPA